MRRQQNLARVNPLWFHHDVLRNYSPPYVIMGFDPRDAENARGRREIEALATLEQIELAASTPMLRHPNFRTIVFQEQRPTGAQVGLTSGPIETTVPLIDEVRWLFFKLSASPICKDHSITQVASCAPDPHRLRPPPLPSHFRLLYSVP